MSVIELFFTRSEGQKRAEQARQDAEDRLMLVHDLEKTDIKFHAECDSERNGVFLARLRELTSDQRANSNRNLLATLFLGGAILLKGNASASSIIHAALVYLGLS